MPADRAEFDSPLFIAEVGICGLLPGFVSVANLTWFIVFCLGFVIDIALLSRRLGLSARRA